MNSYVRLMLPSILKWIYDLKFYQFLANFHSLLHTDYILLNFEFKFLYFLHDQNREVRMKLKGSVHFFYVELKLNPPVSNVPPEMINWNNKALKPLNLTKNWLLWFFAATHFGPGGQTDGPKKSFQGGHLRQGDLTYVPHQKTWTLPLRTL